MKKKIISTIVVFLTLIIILLLFPQTRSYSIMYFYSIYHEHNSLMKEHDLIIDIPGGLTSKEKDWYPFVMTFNDENISSSLNEDIELTVLYNFAAFEDGRSMFYKEDSDYYFSFYGAYVIESKDKEKKYGFNDNEVNIDEITKLAAHDIEALVLKSIGCRNPEVIFEPKTAHKKVDYLSYDGWIMADSIVYSQGPIHKSDDNNRRGYIQYGKPPKDYQGEDFPPVELVGRIYGRYFDEFDLTILMYIIAPNFDIVDQTDRDILSKTVIE